MKMLRFPLRMTNMARTRNEYVRGTSRVEQLKHERTDGGYTEQRLLKMYLPGKRKRGLQRTCRGLVRHKRRVPIR